MTERLERLNVFAGSYLDRQSQLREREDWLADAIANPATVVVPVWQERNLFNRGETLHAHFLRDAQVLLRATDPRHIVLLGEFRGAPSLMIEFDGEAAPA